MNRSAVDSTKTNLQVNVNAVQEILAEDEVCPFSWQALVRHHREGSLELCFLEDESISPKLGDIYLQRKMNMNIVSKVTTKK